MTDRQSLLASIDDMCQRIEVLEKRADKYTQRAIAAQYEAKRAWDLSNDCYAKASRISEGMDDIIAQLRGREGPA